MTTLASFPHPIVTREALAEIYEHARREYPNECRGFVCGAKNDPLAHRAFACASVHFSASDELELSKSLETDEPVKIIYLSHVDVGAAFSPADQAAAQMDGEPRYPVEYLVLDAQKDGVRGAAQLCWNDAEKKYVQVGRYSAL